MNGLLNSAASSFALLALALPALAQGEARLLHVPDGQLYSAIVKVHTNVDLEEGARVFLRFLNVGDELPPTSVAECEERGYPRPKEIVSAVEWTPPGKAAPQSGTLLLFNLSKNPKYPMHGWRPGQRLVPVLYWESLQNSGKLEKSIGREFYLANRWGAVLWAAVVIVVVLAILWALAGVTRHKRNPLALFSYVRTNNGQWSLPLMQMALWTIAVGAGVLTLGLAQLRVPEIPETLLVLIGFSAVTGLAGHWQVKRDLYWHRLTNPEEEGEQEDDAQSGNLSDLVCVRTADGHLAPSLAKAQMIFWTVLTVGLFVWKSVMHGILWEVPQQLVLLMGISQASFLGREQVEMGRKEKEIAEKEKAIKDKEKAAQGNNAHGA